VVARGLAALLPLLRLPLRFLVVLILLHIAALLPPLLLLLPLSLFPLFLLPSQSLFLLLLFFLNPLPLSSFPFLPLFLARLGEDEPEFELQRRQVLIGARGIRREGSDVCRGRERQREAERGKERRGGGERERDL
jgi:hypothetical protein